MCVIDVIGILMGIALNTWLAFANTAIFIGFVLLIHEHGRLLIL
jgi:hypothetical protein